MTKLLELHPQRRDAILNAALKEFSLQGYDHASTNVVAREAGISKSLMFHYVNSKQELFFVMYDYFSHLMKQEYFELMDYKETDIFERLRQSYLLQINLLKKHPWILELNTLKKVTDSPEVNKQLEIRSQKDQSNCYPKLFDGIDETKFRDGLDIEKCKQIIFWSNIGFTNQQLEDIRNIDRNTLDCKIIIQKLDEYLNELRNIFYQSSNE